MASSADTWLQYFVAGSVFVEIQSLIWLVTSRDLLLYRNTIIQCILVKQHKRPTYIRRRPNTHILHLFMSY